MANIHIANYKLYNLFKKLIVKEVLKGDLLVTISIYA